ncbi:hypothetical protein ABIB00_003727 [Bradyrhizobium sp. LB14.3]
MGPRDVEGFPRGTKALPFNGSDRQRKIVLRDLPQNVRSQHTAKDCARCDAATVLTAESNDVAVELVKARQVVRGHSNDAEPAGFKLDILKSRKQLAQRSLSPCPVNGCANTLKGTNTAKHEPPGAIQAK